MSYAQPFFVIDTETGGLPSNLKKEATLEVALTEIAVVVVSNENLEIIDKASWLIKPYADDLIFDPYAAKVSGIDRKMCETQGVPITKAFEDFKGLIKAHVKGKKKPYLVGQNLIDFDYDFINNFLLLHKTSIDGLFSSELKDTMIISREKWPSERKHNLGAICERLGIPYVQAHRALPDTEMTAKVFIEFMKLLRGEYVVQAKSNENEIKERIRFELP